MHRKGDSNMRQQNNKDANTIFKNILEFEIVNLFPLSPYVKS